jgi:hypothetical protein
MLAAESVYDGTWSSGEVPEELRDFEVMLATGWDWEQWRVKTPVYVQRFFWDLLCIRREAEANANEQASQG